MINSKFIVLLICLLAVTAHADESSKLKEFMSTKEGKELREVWDSPSLINNLADIAMFQKLSDLVNARYKEITGNGTSHHHAILWLKNLPKSTKLADKSDQNIRDGLTYLIENSLKTKSTNDQNFKDAATVDVLTEYLNIINDLKPIGFDKISDVTVHIRATGFDEYYEMLKFDVALNKPDSYIFQKNIELKDKSKPKCKFEMYQGQETKGLFTFSCDIPSTRFNTSVTGSCQVNNEEMNATNLELEKADAKKDRIEDEVNFWIWCTNKSSS